MKDALDQLIEGSLPYILVGRNYFPDKAILFPGSFNPLHKGHQGLLLAAERVSDREGLLELSVTNVDKPPLGIVEVECRLLQLKGMYLAVLTCAPTFAEKAELFPGVWFAMGFDTAVRLLDPKYHDDVSAMLARFQTLETRFVVAGRLHAGKFQGLESINIPSGFEKLFIPIPESLFREDVSSTELRGEIGS
ncbi:nucleotidyl transferase family protein [Pontiella sulfatireligans]|uniref:Cytidyltransferase-like domain-containing protein n=1 Tax=Pontiella sulfatireligans TaxID=2750658 RepID=A0A6C2UCY3_9BACT|nr:hypothetical protein [Pontiella sulfatireligans]VGO18052.1 hypothetical protein SCARR_00102 [Pontiella sulfatireligans]